MPTRTRACGWRWEGCPTPWKKLCSITKDPGPPLPEDPGSAGLTGKSRQYGGTGLQGEGLSVKEAYGLGVRSWGLTIQGSQEEGDDHQKPWTASWWHSQPRKHLQKRGRGCGGPERPDKHVISSSSPEPRGKMSPQHPACPTVPRAKCPRQASTPRVTACHPASALPHPRPPGPPAHSCAPKRLSRDFR